MSGVTSEYVRVSGVVTRYSWIGGDIDSKPKRVIIVIPGNPGLCGFYETLMVHLWSSLMGSVDAIWAVSHAGHDPRPADPPFHTNKHSYDLEGKKGILCSPLNSDMFDSTHRPDRPQGGVCGARQPFWRRRCNVGRPLDGLLCHSKGIGKDQAPPCFNKKLFPFSHDWEDGRNS